MNASAWPARSPHTVAVVLGVMANAPTVGARVTLTRTDLISF